MPLLGSDSKLGMANRFALKVLPGDYDFGSWTKADGLDVAWEPAEYRAGDFGNDRLYFPGNTKYSTVKLSRAACQDTEKVRDWLSKTSFSHEYGAIATLTLFDSKGEPIMKEPWEFRDIMPVKWAITTFDAGASKVQVETLEFNHMGFLSDEVDVTSSGMKWAGL